MIKSPKSFLQKKRVMRLSKALVILAALLASCLVSRAEADNDDSDPSLPLRLVRRNFLRFGKRSHFGDDEPSHSGSGEIFEQMSMVNSAHKSSPRSFLRFGRSDNFLRFGKKSDADVADCTDLGEFWLCSKKPSQSKKANRDFLRFG